MKRKAGDVSPSEYDWKTQFDIDTYVPFLAMDVGKVRGLAFALEQAEAELSDWRSGAKRAMAEDCEVERLRSENRWLKDLIRASHRESWDMFRCVFDDEAHPTPWLREPSGAEGDE